MQQQDPCPPPLPSAQKSQPPQNSMIPPLSISSLAEPSHVPEGQPLLIGPNLTWLLANMNMIHRRWILLQTRRPRPLASWVAAGANTHESIRSAAQTPVDPVSETRLDPLGMVWTVS
jgi:hypothetical protein